MILNAQDKTRYRDNVFNFVQYCLTFTGSAGTILSSCDRKPSADLVRLTVSDVG